MAIRAQGVCFWLTIDLPGFFAGGRDPPDLALAGGALLATYRSVRGGHKLNYAVLCALMSDASAWTWVDGEALRPARGHAEVTGRLAPAFGPDIS